MAITVLDNISALPHPSLKQSGSPKSNLLFSPLFSVSENCMYNEAWGCAEILSTCL